MTNPPQPAADPAATTAFDRVVCVVDRRGAGLRATRLASRLARPGGHLSVIALEDADRTRAHALDAALAEIERRDATLAVVELTQHSRAVGIAHGSLATHVLHDARCSVLVVPDGPRAPSWPGSIVVGLDGSVESAAAAAAAWDVAERCGATVRAVAATGRPGHADLELVRRIAPDFEERRVRPVTALAEASEEADLVVLGSRGLRGLRALGSVSERVAHEAHCPVLVVRAKEHGHESR